MNDGQNEDAVTFFPIKNDVAAMLMATHTGSDAVSRPTHVRKISQEGQGMLETVLVPGGLVKAKGLDPEFKYLPYLGTRTLG